MLKVALDGGLPITLGSEQMSPSSIAGDSTSVYWTNDADIFSGGAVMKVPLEGGPPSKLAIAQDNPRGIAVDDTSIYWSTKTTVMKLGLK